MTEDPIAGFIRAQPVVLDATLAAVREFAARWPIGAYDGIALVGAGSSFNAITTAQPYFARAKRGPVTLHVPPAFSRDLEDGITGRPLVVVLSQTGASASSVAAAMAGRAAGLEVLAITADAASPLGRIAVDVLEMPVGAELVGPKTKGFLASVVALLALAEVLGAPPLPPLAGAHFATGIEPARAAAYGLAASLAQADALLLAGDGPLYGIALEGSLKIAEMAGLPTAAWPLEEVLHGRLHGLTTRSHAVVLIGDATALAQGERVARAMAARAAHVSLLNVSGQFGVADWPVTRFTLPGPWAALAALLPLQWLAVALAEARGLAPHAMRYPGLSADLAIRLEPGQ